MLSTPTPFPNPGSLALFEEDGQALPVRIMNHQDDAGLVGISVQGRFGSTAFKSVPFADLLDATALTKAEHEELQTLERALPRGWAMARPTKKSRRVEALRDRAIRAQQLEHLLAKVPAKHFPAAARAMEQAA